MLNKRIQMLIVRRVSIDDRTSIVKSPKDMLN